MNILFLNPYDGGSHRAFAQGWREHSRHDLTVLGLPARHWKWRMRHGAITLAKQAREMSTKFDAVVTTDMLDLPCWRSFAPVQLRDLPTVVYFHENQLLYPDAHKGDRDYHFAFTNLFTAAAASAVWFNSEFHRTGLLAAWQKLLARMPDHAPMDMLAQIAETSAICYPGISVSASASASDNAWASAEPPPPCHLLWAARWEADKAPDAWFAALDQLAETDARFRVSVLGRASRHEPELFASARERLGDRVVHWGWLESRTEYEAALASADVVVSTARHEFFGIAVAEAVAAGAFPLVPRRLAYPELLAELDEPDCFYEDPRLAERLADLCARHDRRELWRGDAQRGRRAMRRYQWKRVAGDMDDRMEAAVANSAAR